jgi:protoheme IX farnesyltransferase
MATLLHLQGVAEQRARLAAWVEVFKWGRCLPAALSAGFGAILIRPVADMTLAVAFLGVLLLALGCAGLNSVQESKTDGLFSRTRHRPLVTGQLSRLRVLVLSVAILAAGLALLASSHHAPHWLPPVLGLSAFLLYNGVYTPLKPVTVLALFPGGLAGGLPPLIGWTCSGGQLADPRAWMLVSLFFLWQIPHYCLIVLLHRQDYRTVSYPSLIRLFPETTLKGITLLWVIAFMVVALTLAGAPHLLMPGPRWVLAAAAILLTALMGFRLFGGWRTAGYRQMLCLFNSTFFTSIALVSGWQILAHGLGV